MKTGVTSSKVTPEQFVWGRTSGGERASTANLPTWVAQADRVRGVVVDLRAGKSRASTSRGAIRRCPCCQSIIYSRRHRLCGVCCQPLPPECLFAPTDSVRVESLIDRERQQHRQW